MGKNSLGGEISKEKSFYLVSKYTRISAEANVCLCTNTHMNICRHFFWRGKTQKLLLLLLLPALILVCILTFEILGYNPSSGGLPDTWNAYTRNQDWLDTRSLTFASSNGCRNRVKECQRMLFQDNKWHFPNAIKVISQMLSFWQLCKGLFQHEETYNNV